MGFVVHFQSLIAFIKWKHPKVPLGSLEEKKGSMELKYLANLYPNHPWFTKYIGIDSFVALIFCQFKLVIWDMNKGFQ